MSPFLIEIDPVIFEKVADVAVSVSFDSGLGVEWAHPTVAVDTWSDSELSVSVTNPDDDAVRYVRTLVIGYAEDGNVINVYGAREKYINWGFLPGGVLGPGATQTFIDETLPTDPVPASIDGIAWASTCVTFYNCD
jgi:hypothetical protein